MKDMHRNSSFLVAGALLMMGSSFNFNYSDSMAQVPKIQYTVNGEQNTVPELTTLSFKSNENTTASSLNYNKVSDYMLDNNKTYNAKSSNKNAGIIANSLELLGDMRNLTAEEEESYATGLKKISKPTGVKLF